MKQPQSNALRQLFCPGHQACPPPPGVCP